MSVNSTKRPRARRSGNKFINFVFEHESLSPARRQGPRCCCLALLLLLLLRLVTAAAEGTSPRATGPGSAAAAGSSQSRARARARARAAARRRAEEGGGRRRAQRSPWLQCCRGPRARDAACQSQRRRTWVSEAAAVLVGRAGRAFAGLRNPPCLLAVRAGRGPADRGRCSQQPEQGEPRAPPRWPRAGRRTSTPTRAGSSITTPPRGPRPGRGQRPRPLWLLSCPRAGRRTPTRAAGGSSITTLRRARRPGRGRGPGLRLLLRLRLRLRLRQRSP